MGQPDQQEQLRLPDRSVPDGLRALLAGDWWRSTVHGPVWADITKLLLRELEERRAAALQRTDGTALPHLAVVQAKQYPTWVRLRGKWIECAHCGKLWTRDELPESHKSPEDWQTCPNGCTARRAAPDVMWRQPRRESGQPGRGVPVWVARGH